MANQRNSTTPSPSTPAGPTPPPSVESPLRVILVGRTELDGRLRLDPAVELVRVRSRLEAIGELAEKDPGDAAASVVIVGAEPDAVNGEAAEFVEALRRVDPNVRVLATGVNGVNGVVGGRANGYDAVVRPDAAADALRRAVRGIGEAAPAPAPHEPMGAQEPRAFAVPASPRSAPRPWLIPQEPDLIGLLLKGRDPVPTLVYRIAARLNDPTLTFVPASGADDGGVPVAWAGRQLGSLRARPGTDASALAREAHGLGAWVALRDQHAALREAAFADPLTGAHNRRYFDRFLASALDEARTARRTVTVLVFDVDDFKTYNDRYGHAAGDEILREAVRMMRSVVRPTDKICRIGGDEFAVIFHDPAGPRTPTSRPPADVFQIARRFQAQVAAHRFPKLGTEAPGTLTISGGLAAYPWDGRTPEELLARADALALESKRQGKNAIRFGPGAEDVGRCDPEP